jgi:hypothetical protein
MISLLEITGDDVALLSDADLRELIGLLCEADFRLAGLPTKGIIWGGHQDASDDGLDVTVRSELPPPENSFVPRRIAGFQVKKPDMPRSRILKEMRPNGKLREVVKDLVRECGAYVIVSSTGSTTEKALKDRKDAMKEAVVDEPNHEQLHLDFLDRGLIANWVRSHPSYILWVRNRNGRPLQGWKPYENWANPSADIQEEYLIDDELRLHDSTSSGIDIDAGASILDGIQTLRSRLAYGTESIRLTGLSGVGKTCLVQALFDDRVGEHPLNPSLAYYTDISYSPNPDPIAFANQLLMAKTKAVLIIDNCSSELHNQLTKLCAHSTVSLLTVEYDISDDVPDETDVFRLEPASDRLIEKLLEKRFTHISQINARTIAEFAGGNARVAIALANTLKRGESLSTLRNEELFKRLFHQRHDPDKGLLISAEICSLVYSFDGVDTTSASSELQFLAELANKSVRELYRNVEELKARGLVQSRGNWRAILPHAIANRLAKHALDSIPKNELVDAFRLNGSKRLIQSFTRRLGYLHDCALAIEIANDWLRPDGWLGNTNCNFNDLGITVFSNIAPIVPEAALAMLERAASDESQETFASGADAHRREFIRLLRHLAYEPDLFLRSTRLLYRYALLEKPDINNSDSARASLKMLFHIILSGTHAPPQIRASIVKELIDSGTQSEQQLGIDLLEAALETGHFYTANTSNFGARPRDYGYWPQSNQERIAWYRSFLDICTNTALSDKSPVASDAKSVLAKKLRGLWGIGLTINQDFLDILEETVTQIHKRQAWNAGWLSVKEILRYGGKSMEQKALLKLKQLENFLRPADILEKARTYALTDRWLGFDLEDDYDENENATSQWKRVQQITREIGAEVAQNDTAFNALLPELVTYSGHNRLWTFGAGLADCCKDKYKMWQTLYAQLEQIPPEKREISVLLGFLSSCAEHDPDFCDYTLVV